MNAINVKLPTNFMPSKVYFSKGDCQMKNLNNTGKKTDEGKGKGKYILVLWTTF